MASDKSADTAGTQALGRVSFLDGQGELPMLEITTPWSRAGIYLQGAHVTEFNQIGRAHV
jgi:hypothetical protein